MTISEASRHALHVRLAEVLGAEEAVVLMEYLPPVGWADVATKRDLDQLAVLTRRDLDHLAIELRGEMAAMEGRLLHAMSSQGRTMYLGLVATILSSIGAVAAAVALVR